MHVVGRLILLVSIALSATHANADGAGLLQRNGLLAGVEVQADGKLDEPVWRDAQRFTDFRLKAGGTPADPSTTVLLANDAQFLYFGITAHEPDMARLIDVVRENTLKVYYDDSIELMLDTDASRSDFYHLFVNPSGYRYQEMRLQTGHVGDNWSNTCWMAGAAKNADGWVVEIVIPLATLNLELEMRSTLRFNVARNRPTGNGLPGNMESSLAEGQFLVPGKFVSYAMKDADLNRFQLRPGDAKVLKTRKEGMQIKAQINLPVANLSREAVTVDLKSVLGSRQGREQEQSQELSLSAGETKTVTLPFTIEQPGQFTLSALAITGNALAMASQQNIEIAYTPVTIDVIRPGYRGMVFASQQINDIEASVRLDIDPQLLEKGKLDVSILDVRGKSVTQLQLDAPSEQQKVSLPAASLVDGNYKVVAKFSCDGNELGRAEQALRKLPKPPGREVRIDDRQRLLIDGKPTLPIMWWSNQVKGVAGTGAHAVLISGSNSKGMDEAAADGLLAVVMLMDGQELDLFVHGKTEFTDEMRQFVQSRVAQFKDHPAMLAWYLKDEPEVTSDSPQLHRAYYECLKELDPYHPVIITNNTVRGVNLYSDAQDIFAPDPYILPTRTRGLERHMSYIALFTQETVKTAAGRKLVGNTPQVFNYGDHGQFDGRPLSFTEQRCSQYLAILHGARFLGYYNFSQTKGYPDLEIGVPGLISEIRALSPAILEGRPVTGLISSNPAVHLAGWEYNGKLYVIACNVEPTKAVATISIPGRVPELQVVSEARSAGVADGRLTDEFLPHGCHIYTDDSQFRSPILLDELQKKIKGAGGMYAVEYPPQQATE